MEKCFIMIKPGVINRRVVGEVLTRLERKGLKLVAMKMMCISRELAEKHYHEHCGRNFFDLLIKYITSGPVIAMVWEADDCVTLVRKLVGSTSVTDAQPGTIRGDYCLHTPYNIIHASDSPDNAQREIGLFFDKGEIISWVDDSEQWY